ncbi:hypothetical protein PAXRUDRAFT_19699 [Paxillus rubicundulus Ve08.2h10]|uniref:Uncharacterized protein n=1 Tax=Paxillus rubicundulus Ve08.2h10 TaxID=930991 RepID=A0A0D0D3T4_9AGAM|nr:hypothetical protein PAXRUDRAFT_19699 [Paxillus rubicundulus Ve08.2h10]
MLLLQLPPPPKASPPSAPPSVPETPCLPIELPSSTVGQDKGKQHADEPWPWDNVVINLDLNVDMDMAGEEDLYKDDADDTNRYQGQKHSVSVRSQSPPPLTPFTYPNKNAMPNTNNRSAFCSGSPASSTGSRSRQSHWTPLSNMLYQSSSTMSSVSSGMPFSSESTSDSPTAATSTLKCSKTVVPTWETICDVVDKGMAAMDDNKAHSSSFKLQKLCLKFDHTCFMEEHLLKREQCTTEQLNAAVVHQRDQERAQMFLAQAELLRLQQGMAKGQE